MIRRQTLDGDNMGGGSKDGNGNGQGRGRMGDGTGCDQYLYELNEVFNMEGVIEDTPLNQNSGGGGRGLGA